jgi:FlaA1/EpsC-like NDP-sugar epimerase
MRRLGRDILLWTLAAPLALLLRYDAEVPAHLHTGAWVYVGLGLVAKVVAVYVYRLHTTSYRKVTFRDVVRLSRAVLVVAALMTTMVWLLQPTWLLARSIPLIEAGVALLLLFGSRGLARVWDERGRRHTGGRGARVLIVGAGEAGALLAREIARHPEMGLELVGMVDDDDEKLGLRLAGVPVLGRRSHLSRLIERERVDEVLIAVPSADGHFVRDVLRETAVAAEALARPVHARVMPGVFEVLAGKASVTRLRQVELEDLLRRDPVRLDVAAIRDVVGGKVVLVTGAGGSIGSEIARQVASLQPRRLVLSGRGENSLFEIERELRATHPHITIDTWLASVVSRDRMRALFELQQPQVVIHAAAHKHVPIIEAHPEEAVLNNILGTEILVDLALEFCVERFVNISSDKAVRPSSVMGASKRVAEAIVKRAAAAAQPGVQFVSVRFGNVLGSRGSVVPIFRRQIAAGGPVTITDKRMTRYFMTVPEASQLVLQALSIAENGVVYFLDMGEPVRILDLAEDMVRLSGLEPHIDIEIIETGIRPGEKLFEELLLTDEKQSGTAHEKIWMVRGEPALGVELELLLPDLVAAARAGDGVGVAHMLSVAIPDGSMSAMRVA